MDKKFIKILKEFVAIPSVSTDSKYGGQIKRAVEYLVDFCVKNNLKVQVFNGFENPIIVAKTPFISGLETVLIYGHYDVQPAEKFSLVKKGSKLFGRGTADNKGQILIHLCSVAKLTKEKKLGFNVIFLIEGNEETGSVGLRKFVEKNKSFLKADFLLVSDSELGPNNIPALEGGFRGSMNFEVTLETGKEDLHSGLFGGVAPNATEELGKILGSLTEFTGRKNGFVPGSNLYENRRTLESTVEVTGFVSGYTDIGFKNSIPCKATAKINVRSVPNGNPKKLVMEVKKFILSKAPKYAKISFVDGESAQGIVLNLNNKFAKRAKQILKEVYSEESIIKNGGGTLPIADTFKRVLKIPQVMVPLADENCGAHSASEFISLKAVEKGLVFSSRFFGK